MPGFQTLDPNLEAWSFRLFFDPLSVMFGFLTQSTTKTKLKMAKEANNLGLWIPFVSGTPDLPVFVASVSEVHPEGKCLPLLALCVLHSGMFPSV